ncbi:hypothetical protein [Candidatus Electronema sp. PJ]|uniref:hypothetical protein n=1 Tax=Candidatus Electronema sp. PJ TaxID=3401572 RepID=UPI003AA8A81D
MQRRTSHFLLLGHVLLGIRQLVNYAREESSALGKELESATEEFGLAKLLSWLATKESGRLRKEF